MVHVKVAHSIFFCLCDTPCLKIDLSPKLGTECPRALTPRSDEMPLPNATPFLAPFAGFAFESIVVRPPLLMNCCRGREP